MHGTIVLCFLTHMTHKLQTLDVSYFQPLNYPYKENPYND
jgi:hypothetical protein